MAGPPKKRNKTNHKQISVNSNVAKHQKLPLKPNNKLAITPAQRAPAVVEQKISKATVPNGVVVETKQKPKGKVIY